ncbi:MAG TPA: hypothetical protein PKH24_18605 [Sedimentisphaerales bacterium]|nr:hypothetical protein [Sedimentisphaerales bacterium]HNU31039.1 hypothetical protein [Sedimentisphaerales bacterium]
MRTHSLSRFIVALCLLVPGVARGADLPSVRSLSVSDVTCETATLRAVIQSDGGEACQYRFRYRPAGGSYIYTDWAGSVRTGQSFSAAISGLTVCTTYEYSAQAKNSAGEGDWLSDAPFRTVCPPTVYSLSSNTITCTTANIRAVIQSDGGEACQYRFRYRAAGGDYTYTPWAGSVRTGNSFTEAISGLTACTTYEFSAQARNCAGEGIWTSDASFKTVCPPTVYSLSANTITCTTANIRAVIQSDGGEACEYRFCYRPAGGEYTCTPWAGSVRTGNSITEAISGLTACTTYEFAAQARNCAGEGTWTSDASFKTVCPPAVYSLSTNTITCTTANIRAVIQSDGGQACEYRFRYRPVGGTYTYTEWAGSVRTGNSITEAISGLTACTTYEFAAQARNCAGEGSWSGEASFKTVCPPAVYSLSSNTITCTTANIRAVIQSDGGEACEYRFRYRPAGGDYTYTAWAGSVRTGNSITEAISGLTACTTYEFAAQARNCAGEGTWTSDTSFKTVCPPAVYNLSSNTITSTTANIRAMIQSDGGQACEYRFRYRPAGSDDYTYTEWAGSVRTGNYFTLALSGLLCATTYEYSAQARNCAGEGTWPSNSSFKTLVCPRVDPPTVSTYDAIDITATSATLQGYLEDDGGGDCQGQFEITSDSGTATLKVPGSITEGQVFTASAPDLTPDSTYQFRAGATNSAGTSWGEWRSFTTPPDSVLKVVTDKATDVNATSATLHGHLVDDGGAACQRRFRFRRVGDTEDTLTKWVDVAQGEAFEYTATGLTPDSTYHFAAEAMKKDGSAMSQGKSLEFRTPPLERIVLHVDDDAAGDSNQDGTETHPYDSIQEAIDAAGPRALVLVHEGVYPECLDLTDKDITVRGLWLTDPNVAQMPVVDGNGIGPVVTFAGRAAGACTLSGLLITGGKGERGAAISCVGADPVIAHCVIGGNMAGGATGATLSFEDSNAVMIHCTVTGNLGDSDSALMAVTACTVAVSNCIFWNNIPAAIRTVSGAAPGITYSDVQGGWPGMGNLNGDPLFADPGVWSNASTPADPSDDAWVPADCHLQSAKGRFWPDFGWWLPDKKTSPCIDAGDPASPVGDEPTPNGGRVNLGAYGGTSQASLSN